MAEWILIFVFLQFLHLLFKALEQKTLPEKLPLELHRTNLRAIEQKIYAKKGPTDSTRAGSYEMFHEM